MIDKEEAHSTIEGKYHHESAVKEAKWRALVEEITDAVLIINKRGIIQEANPSAKKMFGYTPDELSGHNVSILMPEPDQNNHDRYIQHYLKTGEKRVIGQGREVQAKRKDGIIFPVFLSVSEARYDGVRLFVGIIRDLSETKRNEEQLFQAQKYESIAQLTAGVAHDFNNLLTVIQGNLEMLARHVSNETGQEILSEVLDAIDDGNHLVKQLLAFGRKQVLKPEFINVNGLIRETLRLLRRTITDAIEIEDKLAQNLPTVKVDPIQLENALINLVINARDALTENGKIRIETALVSTLPSHLRPHDVRPDVSYVRISVSDNGVGMPKEVQDRAFEPFFTTKRHENGTGLGLSMVQGFLKQSNGEVLIESEPGAGTTVSLYFPGSSEISDADHNTGSKNKQYQNTAKKIILLVDDNPKVRKINAQRLERIGYQVLQAGSGKQALEILSKNPKIDLLFSDIVMPGGMHGHELAAEACRLKPTLKILLTTGYSEEHITAKARHYRVLTKPYSVDQLAECLNAVLNQPQNPINEERRTGQYIPNEASPES